MRTMKATLENKKVGGGRGANHNDRSFDTSHADNIGDIRQDQTWIFPDNEPPKRIRLQNHELENFEMGYYMERYGDAVEAQRERHLKARQKKRAEGCTLERYYNSPKTCPTSTVLQVGKEWEYTDRKKFVKMVNTLKNEIEEETEDARIKVLSISVHGSEDKGSLHVHMAEVFEVKDKYGNWTVNQDACLKRLGYTLPEPKKKTSRYNCRAMDWTSKNREKWYDIIERIDPEIRIDRTPDPNNPKTKGKVNRTITEMSKLKKLIRELETELESLEKCMGELDQKTLEARKEKIRESLAKTKIVFGKMRDYIGETPAKKPVEKPVEAPIEEPEDWEYDL